MGVGCTWVRMGFSIEFRYLLKVRNIMQLRGCKVVCERCRLDGLTPTLGLEDGPLGTHLAAFLPCLADTANRI
jgi:hypothetical protein